MYIEGGGGGGSVAQFENPIRSLKFLYQLGQDPNIKMRARSGQTQFNLSKYS